MICSYKYISTFQWKPWMKISYMAKTCGCLVKGNFYATTQYAGILLNYNGITISWYSDIGWVCVSMVGNFIKKMTLFCLFALHLLMKTFFYVRWLGGILPVPHGWAIRCGPGRGLCRGLGLPGERKNLKSGSVELNGRHDFLFQSLDVHAIDIRVWFYKAYSWKTPEEGEMKASILKQNEDSSPLSGVNLSLSHWRLCKYGVGAHAVIPPRKASLAPIFLFWIMKDGDVKLSFESWNAYPWIIADATIEKKKNVDGFYRAGGTICYV